MFEKTSKSNSVLFDQIQPKSQRISRICKARKILKWHYTLNFPCNNPPDNFIKFFEENVATAGLAGLRCRPVFKPYMGYDGPEWPPKTPPKFINLQKEDFFGIWDVYSDQVSMGQSRSDIPTQKEICLLDSLEGHWKSTTLIFAIFRERRLFMDNVTKEAIKSLWIKIKVLLICAISVL